MQMRWGRVIAGAIAAEALPVVILILAVAVFGPTDATQAGVYAARLGRWIGPLGGALAVFLLARWVARPTGSLALRHGFWVGCLTAALDIAVLLATGSAFEWLFAVSNSGRVVAGLAGGLLSARTAKPA